MERMKAAAAAVVLSLAAPLMCAQSFSEFEKLEKGAMAGRYQDQRNLAYWLSSGYNNALPQNPVLACAWRLVILESGSRSVDATDVSNKQFLCDRRLDADGMRAATHSPSQAAAA